MLVTLKINNYALIDELFVEFHQGLNIITGETGAGKSILLGALGLILGKRADTSVLSHVEKKCVVEAEFNLEGYQLEHLFEENDVDFDIHTVFRREILTSGKSRAFINDTPVNLSVLQDLALRLVDIHSQHQNLLLNQQEFLLNIIDRYCKHDILLADYKRNFIAYKNLKKVYEEALNKFNSIKTEMEFLSHQVNELSEAKVKDGEINQIEQELSQLDNAEEIKSSLHIANQALSADDNGIIDKLQSVSVVLNKIINCYPAASELSQRLESARIELKELNIDLFSGFDKLEFDPSHQEQLRNRLDLLLGLIQKYRVNSDSELIAKLEHLNQKLLIGIDGEFELEKQKAELQKIETKTFELAEQLSISREESFSQIQSKVVSVLHDLGIAHGQLKIENIRQEMTLKGMDNISFLFSANKNHALQNVSKIASGGELSRLMLSVKALLADSMGMPTIILDEIDTGVSGEIADKVGNIIRLMSKGMQVVNITHLPQVASKAEAHYIVYKDHTSELTKTKIRKLGDNERLQEIAKMLSGEEITDAAIENARALLSSNEY